MKQYILPGKRTSGQSVVEFALSLPILLLLSSASIDLGNMLYSSHRLSAATREGAKVVAEMASTTDDISRTKGPARTRTQRVLIDSGIPVCLTTTCAEGEASVSVREVNRGFCINKEHQELKFLSVHVDYAVEPITPFWKLVYPDGAANSSELALQSESTAYFNMKTGGRCRKTDGR